MKYGDAICHASDGSIAARRTSMPVISVDIEDLEHLLGFEPPHELLIERIPLMGADIERDDGETLQIEFFPDRPDLYSVEGIARALRAFLGHDPGLRQYDVTPSGFSLVVDESVLPVRPDIVAAVVRDVTMTDALITSLMDLQEKLHLTMGRKRKKVSIGVHDLDAVEPPFTYKGVDPEAIQFVPLQHHRSMDLDDILRYHEKGKRYAWILEEHDRYPVIVDRNDDVLSFPPVINGVLTQITEETENIFIDVTGLDRAAIDCALNIVATALAERGATLESVVVQYPNETLTRPALGAHMMELDIGDTNRILGMQLTPDEVREALRKMGFDVTFGCDPEDTSRCLVAIPAYRNDILHMVDLVEDVAVGYGYRRFTATLPQSMTFGATLPEDDTVETLRTIMIGLGYQEIMTLTLSNDDDQFHSLGIEPPEDAVRVKNPIGESYTNLRASLIPSLLTIIEKNKHRDLPQRIFEVGVILAGARNRPHIACASIHAKAGFTEIKSVVGSIIESLAAEKSAQRSIDIEPSIHPLFIPGRAATLSDAAGSIGFFGEVAPRTLLASDIGYPVVAFEADLLRLVGDAAPDHDAAPVERWCEPTPRQEEEG